MSLKYTIIKRKSIIKFDEKFRIPRHTILEAIELASKALNANNIQNTCYLLSEDPNLRNQILLTYNQGQIVNSSYLILILSYYNTLNEQNIKVVNDRSVELNIFDISVSTRLIQAAINYYKDMDTSDQRKELVRDGSLAAISLVLILNDMVYQTITMSGYYKDELFNVLNISSNYEDIMLLSWKRN